jgi:hypothetical protein
MIRRLDRIELRSVVRRVEAEEKLMISEETRAA